MADERPRTYKLIELAGSSPEGIEPVGLGFRVRDPD